MHDWLKEENQKEDLLLKCPKCNSARLSHFWNWEGECDSWECKDCKRIWDESNFLYSDIDKYV
jgi:hypothetical protein